MVWFGQILLYLLFYHPIYMIIGFYLHTVFRVSTEEHGLSSVISKPVSPVSWKISTLWIIGSHTGLVVLLQPLRIGKRQLREHSLSLHEVPGSSDIVVPGDHPLHGVPHHVHVDWHLEIKPAIIFRNQ